MTKRNLLQKTAIVVASIVLPMAVHAKQVGKVDFKVSCKPTSQKMFNDALAQVHNMMYKQAEQDFQSIIKQDNACAMAYWGVALAQVHPLWHDKPSTESLEKGAQALQKAATNNNTTEREQAFIKALQVYYQDHQNTPEKERIKRWEKAQQTLYEKYPQDPDAIAFYALTHLAVAPKDDKDFLHQQKAGAILESMFEKFAEHPAVYHYTIHAYDNPKLAQKAEKFARGYDKIAPAVPHALHMPSHIFVRLGYWPESIKWNRRSADAAKSQPLANGQMSMHYAHALDYLMYAYLQQSDELNAKKVLAELKSVKNYHPSFPAAYGLAAAQSRYFLERRDGAGAVRMQLYPTNFPWKQFPYAEGIAVFTNGLGLIYLDRDTQAKENIQRLSQIYQQLKDQKQDYWATLTDAKRKALVAYVEFKKGDRATGLKMMAKAADIEDSVDKHPVTPSEVAPIRELYAQMLYRNDNYKDALAQFRMVLKTSPNRFNSLYGAGLAAQSIGDRKIALQFYKQLVIQANGSKSRRVQLQEAKDYIINNLEYLS